MVDTASTRQDTTPFDQAKMGWERDKRLETTDPTPERSQSTQPLESKIDKSQNRQ